MKRIVICLLLITAMALTGGLLYTHTKTVTDEVSAELAELEAHPDPEAAYSLLGKWEDFRTRNIYLTNNECADEISRSLARIAAGASLGRDIREDCRSTGTLLAIYERSCAPLPENIF